MRPFLFVFWLAQQLWQLGDIRRDPPRLKALSALCAFLLTRRDALTHTHRLAEDTVGAPVCHTPILARLRSTGRNGSPQQTNDTGKFDRSHHCRLPFKMPFIITSGGAHFECRGGGKRRANRLLTSASLW